MSFHTPRIAWDGPTVRLHLRMIDGTVCLFDDQGRMVTGVRSIVVDQSVSAATQVNVSLFVARPGDATDDAPRSQFAADVRREVQRAAAADPRFLRGGAG